MYKYPPDGTILNGQWSVFLHVKTAGAATGSESCVIYTVDQEGQDVFLGWMVPWNQSSYSTTVYTEVKASGQWPGRESWDSMVSKIDGSSKTSTATNQGTTAIFKTFGSIGDDTSPLVNYVVSEK